MELPIDPAVAHHWFATELNNLAWSLLEDGDSDRETVDVMVHASHGSTRPSPTPARAGRSRSTGNTNAQRSSGARPS